jgi:hypothetical protein
VIKPKIIFKTSPSKNRRAKKDKTIKEKGVLISNQKSALCHDQPASFAKQKKTKPKVMAIIIKVFHEDQQTKLKPIAVIIALKKGNKRKNKSTDFILLKLF